MPRRVAGSTITPALAFLQKAIRQLTGREFDTPAGGVVLVREDA